MLNRSKRQTDGDWRLEAAPCSYFSETYREATGRFRAAATTLGAELRTYELRGDWPDELTVDVAIVGQEHDATLVISSGVHGVEGFFGSAVQLAFLTRLRQAACRHALRYVLIHGVNPFGFSRLRRCNEDNVDLNRNFLLSRDDYAGAPDGYDRLHGLLNPASPPSRFEPFTLKAYGNILLAGTQPLKEAVAAGQYEYPRGLFFGGHGRCRSTEIVQANCDAWLGSSAKILHIDLHTGLGPFASHKLLLAAADRDTYAWYSRTFGTKCVEPPIVRQPMAYRTSGGWGAWLRNHFSERDYRFAYAEFGTYHIIRVLAAIRAENRAHHYCSPNSPPFHWSKRELLECFCPTSRSWRRRVVESALRIIDQGSQAM